MSDMLFILKVLHLGAHPLGIDANSQPAKQVDPIAEPNHEIVFGKIIRGFTQVVDAAESPN